MINDSNSNPDQPATSLKPFGVTEKFPLGQMTITPAAQEAIADAGQQPIEFLIRHATGDWGELDSHDKQMNDRAIANESDPDKRDRVLSCYHTSKGVKLYVITEHDRSYTTVLLASDY